MTDCANEGLVKTVFDGDLECANERLVKAVLECDLEQVRFFLSAGADPNYRLKNHGGISLHFTQTPEIAHELLSFGADVNAVDFYKQSPLCCAVANNCSLELVRLLLSAGADVNIRMLMDNTPLHVAPNVELTNELLAHGADVNAVDYFERAPIHSAMIDGKGFQVFTALLAAGACVNITIGRFENSLLHYADSLEMTRELLSRGVNVNVMKIDGQTPLHCAVKHMKEAAVVRELLKHGAEVNAEDNEGDTSLVLALRCHPINFEVVRELVEYGGDINFEMFDYSLIRHCTVIDCAAYHDMTCAKILLRIFILKNFEIDFGTNIDLDADIHPVNCRNLFCYKDDCILEIVQMKSDRINAKLTLYELLLKEGDFVKPMFGNFRSIEKEIVAKYPIYHDVIMRRLMKFLERGRLLNRLGEIEVSLSHAVKGIENEIKLNLDCIFMIARYLSDDEIYNFIVAFE